MIENENEKDKTPENIEKLELLNIPEGTILFENKMRNEYLGSKLIAVKGKLVIK